MFVQLEHYLKKDFEAPKIDHNKCIRCGKCSNFCPKKSISIRIEIYAIGVKIDEHFKTTKSSYSRIRK